MFPPIFQVNAGALTPTPAELKTLNLCIAETKIEKYKTTPKAKGDKIEENEPVAEDIETSDEEENEGESGNDVKDDEEEEDNGESEGSDNKGDNDKGDEGEHGKKFICKTCVMILFPYTKMFLLHILNCLLYV